METGYCVTGGSRRSRAASVSSRPASRVSLSMTVSITSALSRLPNEVVVQNKKDAQQGVPLLTSCFLCSCGMLHEGISQRSPQNAPRVGWRTNVGSARVQSGGPHVLVGQTVRANDTGFRKLTRQMFDIGNGGSLHVQNGNTRNMFFDAIAQFAQ